MTFEATAIKVMIASPSDVTAERQIIRDTIAVWNAVHAEDRRQVLLPIGWDTHASPELGAQGGMLLNRTAIGFRLSLELLQLLHRQRKRGKFVTLSKWRGGLDVLLRPT